MKKFKILGSKKFDFYTNYKIYFCGNVYECNYNGGLPKLEGKRLSEADAVELSNILEEYFLLEEHFSKR